MSKRARTSGYTAAKRAIDKRIKTINVATTNSTSNTVLQTITFPRTIAGLRWSLAYRQTGTASADCWWAIVISHDGINPGSLSTTDADDLYTPEQNVMAFGIFTSPGTGSTAGSITEQAGGSTKAMRKMKAGDTFHFITLSNSASSGTVKGAIQWFTKS